MKKCPRCKETIHIIKKGYFKTKWNYKLVPRYKCKPCGKSFSASTAKPIYKQKKPFLNRDIFKWYVAGTTQRRMAIVMGINRKTVVRKFLYMAEEARAHHEKRLKEGKWKTGYVQFDEMETFEHTRLKPLSIALAVRPKTAEVIEAQVGLMKFHGRATSLSRDRYGWVFDTRDASREDVLLSIKKIAKDDITIVTDKKTDYPQVIQRVIPNAKIVQVKRGRKKTIYDERQNEDDDLFVINYVSAQIRHDLSRMMRKSWVTTKKAFMLQAHLDLFIAWKNKYAIK